MQVRDTIREGLRAEKGERIRSGATGMHAYASRAGGCMRQVAYEAVAGSAGHEAADESTTLIQEIAFFIGRQLELAVKNAILLQDPTAQYQVPWVHESGAIAGISDFLYVEGRRRVVVEVKSTGQWAFDYSLTNGPKRDHRLQAAVAAVALRATHIHIIYLNKNGKPGSDPIAEWVEPIPQEEAQSAIFELMTAIDYAKKGQVAPAWHNGDVIKVPTLDREPCKWCPFINRCLDDGHAFGMAINPADRPQLVAVR